jgi:hypothetical protein
MPWVDNVAKGSPRVFTAVPGMAIVVTIVGPMVETESSNFLMMT